MKTLTGINAAVTTNTGLVRTNNEDNFYFNGTSMEEESKGSIHLEDDFSSNSYLFAVCDGMGGESCGEKASLAAVKELKKYQTFSDNQTDMQSILDILNEYVEKTNDLIYDMSFTDNEVKRMGTTFAGLVLCENQVASVNLGDSRVYMLRDGVLTQLTTDHTEAERLVKLGIITREQSRNNKGRYKLTRHFGVSREEGRMEADVSGIVELQEGDRFLVCSDGLTDMVTDERIKELLLASDKAGTITETLVEEALKNGGNDNITALAVIIKKPNQPCIDISNYKTDFTASVSRKRKKIRRRQQREKKRFFLFAVLLILVAVTTILLIKYGH